MLVFVFQAPLTSWKQSWDPLSKQRANSGNTITHSALLCLWRNHCICQIHQPFPQRRLPACETDHLPWGLRTIAAGDVFYSPLKYLMQESAMGPAIKSWPGHSQSAQSILRHSEHRHVMNLTGAATLNQDGIRFQEEKRNGTVAFFKVGQSNLH